MGNQKGVQGASGASDLHFGENFIKQKLQSTPDLVGVGHLWGPQIWIWKDLCPRSCWSHGNSLWRGVDKTNVVVHVTNSYLVSLDTLYPDSGFKWSYGASAVHFGRYFITQKLQSTSNIVWMGHLFGPQNWIWKDLGLVCFWSRGPPFSTRVYNIKVVVYVSNKYLVLFLPIVHDNRGYLNTLYSSD